MEPPIIEQVITELFAKSLHIILSSRSPFVSSHTSSSPRDKWFDLALPTSLQTFDLYRNTNLHPLIIDILLLHRHPPQNLLERWTIQYHPRKDYINVSRFSLRQLDALYRKTYDRAKILLRSLYVTVRLLPAYRVFRELNSSSKIRPVSLSHTISGYGERLGEVCDGMREFSFGSVDTACGRVSISVLYVQAVEEVGSECSSSAAMSPQFIVDYVGSPEVERLKRVGSNFSGGMMDVSDSFSRRHSWSIDHGGMSSMSASPSAHSGFRSNLSRCMTDELARGSNVSYDEDWPSPPFSPSVSPSGTAHLLSGQLANAIVRTESAPVSGSVEIGKGSGLLNQDLPEFASRKVMKHGCSSQADAQASQTSSPERVLRITNDSPRFPEFQTGLTLQKVVSLGREDVTNLYGLCGSRIGVSRSSSNRLSLLDEMDTADGAFPFAVEDEDLANSCYRTEYSDALSNESRVSESGGLLRSRRSSDAEVGALVRMLKTAPPLRQDLSMCISSSQDWRDEILNERILYDKDILDIVQKNNNTGPSSEISASGLLKSRTTAEALGELRHYKEMKEHLVGQTRLQALDTDQCTEQSAKGVPGEL